MFEKIKKLCINQKISVRELEKHAGLSNGTINKWKHGAPKVNNLQKVADYFGVTIDYLVRGNAEDEAHNEH